MSLLYDAADEVQQFLRRRGWRFCIIGGLAVVRWGQPRLTQDVDFSLLTGLGAEQHYIDALLAAFRPRIPDAAPFALQSRVLLVWAANDVPIDIALAAFPYEEQVIARASEFEFVPGLPLLTASAEDTLVLKAFAARDTDWVDVEGIVVRQAHSSIGSTSSVNCRHSGN
jgi:hypothetical protein